MKLSARPTAYEIKWKDAYSDNAARATPGQKQEPHLLTYTVGYLVRADKGSITVAQNCVPYEDGTFELRNLLTVPRGIVLKFRRVK